MLLILLHRQESALQDYIEDVSVLLYGINYYSNSQGSSLHVNSVATYLEEHMQFVTPVHISYVGAYALW